MKLSASKPSGKTMRVATMFTGVAAATVAMGQTAKAGVYSGSIRPAYSCTNRHIDPTWVHVGTFVYNNPTSPSLEVDCYGGHGTYLSPRGHGLIALCGGNNHGFVTGFSTRSPLGYFINFGPRTTYWFPSRTSLYDVTIYSWTGADQCKTSTL